MKKLLLSIGVLFYLMTLSLITYSQKKYETDMNQMSDTSFFWPGNNKMALSLTFDDGRPSQIDTGIPIFNKYDVKGTFYVSPDWMQERLAGWVKAVTEGHEIGNHSMVHPCTGNFLWSKDHALESYTLTDMARELNESNLVIKKLLGVYPVSFAYPCGQTFIGRGEELKSYMPLVDRMFENGRGWLDESPNDPVYCDLSHLTGIESDGKRFEEIKLLFDQAKENGSWLILAGHDIGDSGAQTTLASTLEEICKYAKDPSNEIWIAPVGKISRYVNDHASRKAIRKTSYSWDPSNTLLGKVGDLIIDRDYPNAIISNDLLKMKLYLPDPENGYYRATRFDWSGIIGSLKYKGHEYFGEWKDTQDPFVHEDLSGPVESFNKAGLGYDEAKVGEHFVRLGVGVLVKPEEEGYQWSHTYEVIDHGEWTIEHGKDWILFTHVLNTNFGYAYVYSKKIELKKGEAGFRIIHTLKNTGTREIVTDQYNHNFFVMEGQMTGPDFSVTFPYPISIKSQRANFEIIDINKNVLGFKDLLSEGSVWLELSGYSNKISDHIVTVKNNKVGTGVTFKMDKPIYQMVFWATTTTLCPENFIMIEVEPGNEDTWISEYTVF